MQMGPNPGEEYDPFQDDWWTLAMAVAWIADRTKESVVEHSPFGSTYEAQLLLVMFVDDESGFRSAADRLITSIARRAIATTATATDRLNQGNGTRGPIPEPHLDHLVIQGGSDIDGLLASALDGSKFHSVCVSTKHVLREWPPAVTHEGDEIYDVLEQRGQTFSLYDAAVLVGSRGQPMSSKQIAEQNIAEEGVRELAQMLAYDGLVATGRNREALRVEILAAAWEAAKYGYHHTEPDTHRIEFIDNVTRMQFGGTLTLHSQLLDRKPDWVDIRIPAAPLRALLEKAEDIIGKETARTTNPAHGSIDEAIRAAGGISALSPSEKQIWDSIKSLGGEDALPARRGDYTLAIAAHAKGRKPSDSTIDRFFRRFRPPSAAKSG